MQGLIISKRENRIYLDKKTSYILMEKNIFSIEIVDEVPKRMKNCFAVYGEISNT